MNDQKYVLVRAGAMPVHRSNKFKSLYLIKALRDIPKYGVKAGDFGGYVTDKKILSHEGSCWIGGSAQVMDNVVVEEDAYIGDNALVHAVKANWGNRLSVIEIRGNARITGDATVVSTLNGNDAPERYKRVIAGEVHVHGNAYLDSVEKINSNAKIYGNAYLNRVQYIGEGAEIYDDARIGRECIITSSKIFGKAEILGKTSISGSCIFGHAIIPEGKKIINGKLDEGQLYSAKDYVEGMSELFVENPELVSPVILGVDTEQEIKPAKISKVERDYQEICASIDEYRCDIVKIIKYPVMTDRTDPFTLKMMMALKAAQRLEDEKHTVEFKEAVVALEEAFMMAESNAEKIASSLLSDVEKKKMEKAKDLLRIASDKGAAENEKKMAFKQGFKQLEGVITVPEVAIDTFRKKIGLPELEGF